MTVTSRFHSGSLSMNRFTFLRYSLKASLPFRVSPAQTRTLTNTARITGYIPDGDPLNNTAVETTTVQTWADLMISKHVQPGLVFVGEPLTYTFAITNDGPEVMTTFPKHELIEIG